MKSLLLTLPLILALSPAVEEDFGALSVSVVAGDDGLRCTVRGTNIPVDRIARELAVQSGRELTGFEGVARAALVTVELVDRSLEEALEVSLGAVGLRAELRSDLVRVVPSSFDVRSPKELRELATASYLSALQRYPAHPLGASARLSQASIEEARGNHAAALEHLRALVDSYRTSPLVHQARLRAAGILIEKGRHAEAATDLRLVAAAAGAAPWHALARLELARTTLALGNPELCEAMIATLERSFPSGDRQVIAERELVRAEAYLALERWVDALHAVERCASLGMPTTLELPSMAVRARAFEGLDMPKEASRAWLIVATMDNGKWQQTAFERAAALALESEEEVSVLFIAAAAEQAGSTADVMASVFEARRRLGLPEDTSTLEPELALAYAEELANSERWNEVHPTLEQLHGQRGQLNYEDFVRLATVRARQSYALAGIDAALSVLRDARWELESSEARQPLDRVAAELLEQGRNFERAMLAYEGVY